MAIMEKKEDIWVITKSIQDIIYQERINFLQEFNLFLKPLL